MPDTRVDAGHALMPLTIRDLSLSLRGKRVFNRLTLSLPPAGCTVIMGPNGAGKSLFLRVIHGLVRADAGHVDWNGLTPENARSRQAMVFQKPVLLRRSVAANVDFVLRARHGRRPAVRARDRDTRDSLLDHVGLADKAHQPARSLSGGEAQLLALARALATDPQVLLLDEPTSSLDPGSVQRIEAIVTRALARGTQIILVTHDPAHARRLANQVVFLHHGAIIEQSPAEVFFPRPKSDVAQAYLTGELII